MHRFDAGVRDARQPAELLDIRARDLAVERLAGFGGEHGIRRRFVGRTLHADARDARPRRAPAHDFRDLRREIADAVEQLIVAGRRGVERRAGASRRGSDAQIEAVLPGQLGEAARDDEARAAIAGDGAQLRLGAGAAVIRLERGVRLEHVNAAAGLEARRQQIRERLLEVAELPRAVHLERQHDHAHARLRRGLRCDRQRGHEARNQRGEQSRQKIMGFAHGTQRWPSSRVGSGKLLSFSDPAEASAVFSRAPMATKFESRALPEARARRRDEAKGRSETSVISLAIEADVRGPKSARTLPARFFRCNRIAKDSRENPGL